MALPHFASSQKAVALRGCKTCLARISHHPLSPFIPQRTFLWWWKRGDSDWTSAQDENLKQQIRLRNRRLQFKYVKALHRRNLWDRDSSHNAQRPTWMWPELDALSKVVAPSSDECVPPKSTLRENQTEASESVQSLAHHKKAETEDPFMAFFGSRLTASQNPQDSTWSIFSYEERGSVLDQDTKRSKSPDQFKGSRESRPARSAAFEDGSKVVNRTVSKTPSRRGAITDNTSDDYEFDPISMRNIPKIKGSDQASPETSKPLFDSLFAEKTAVDIPVKVYKPHRVYGHTAKASGDEGRGKSVANTTNDPKRSETSRAAEFRKLKASTLGNSIDTAAEFHGKWPPPDKKIEERPKKRNDTPSEVLFAGTTYDGKFKDTLSNGQSSKGSWLEREGFTSDQKESASTFHKKASHRLQTSLDRTVAAGSSKNTTEQVSPVAEQRNSRQEDLDLLRASDVRASAKSARPTKQERERTQSSLRDKLDQKFKALEEEKDDSGTEPIRSLSGLWQRIQNQEKSWLSGRVIPSETREHSSTGSKPKTNVFAPKSLPEKAERPKIMTSKPASPVTAFTPSPEVLKAERENSSRTQNLREATSETKKQWEQQRENEVTLAKQLNEIYVSEYGQVQAPSTAVSPEQNPTKETVKTNTQQPVPTPKTPALPSATPRSPPPTPPSTLYKILAYDSSTLQVSSATTTSSAPLPLPDPEAPIAPPEILSRLNSPVKFLPYFSALEREGYEMVTGSGDILIFKQVREGGGVDGSKARVGAISTAVLGDTVVAATTNKAPTTSPPAQPQPTPSHPSPFSSPSPKPNKPSTIHGQQRVHRQEAVFSAPLSSSRTDWDPPVPPSHSTPSRSEPSTSSSSGPDQPRTFGRVVRRVLLAGSGMAVVAYGVGVVLEGEDLVKRGGVGKRVVSRRRRRRDGEGGVSE